MRNIRFVLILAVLVTVFGNLRAQSPTQSAPTFRAGIDLVQLDVSVMDRDRQPVRGLTARDFQVLEDGRPH
jgi:hypothetical protein